MAERGSAGERSDPGEARAGLRRASAVIAAYALLAGLVTPVYPHFVSPNEFTRWLLAAAIVEHRTVEVSLVVGLLGRRFEDLSEKDGRLYSNKAPGLAFLALPGYLAGRLWFGPPSAGSMRGVVTAMRFVGSTVPLLYLGWLFLRLGVKHGRRSPTVLWILLFGTPLFVYGLLLFSHAVVTAALFGAWASLFAIDVRRPWHDWIAGALIGVAVCCEYPALIPALVLGIGLAVRGAWSAIGRVVMGGMPFAAALAVYNTVAFGGPFVLSTWYDRLPEYRALGRTALFGVNLPSLEIALRLLLDPSRGLLVFSPVLILAVPALLVARRQLDRAAFWTLVAVPATILVFYAGYPNWHGGWAVGPRYLTGAIPFLVYPMLFRDGGILEGFLSGWSAVAVVTTALVFPFPPNAFSLPWSSLAIPLLKEGLVAPNLFHLWARPLAITVPFVIVGLAMAIGWRGIDRVAVVIGATIVIVLGAQAQRFDPQTIMLLQRSYIEEVYFERRGALHRRVSNIGSTQPRLVRRAEMERLLPPSSWPF
jgi:hypothetical protein